MKLFQIYTCLAFMALTACTDGTPQFELTNGVLIENATIVSADKKGTLKQYPGHVLIDADTIVYAGQNKPRVTGNVSVIDGKGKYIIPGLIDSHVHLANIAGMTWSHKREHPELLDSYLKQLPKSFLYFGYTTLIDLNNYAPRVLETINRQPTKPDIYSCGQQLQVMNDFMMVMEEIPLSERLTYPFLFDKYNKGLKIPDSIDLDSHSPKAIVENIVSQQNGIGLKIAYEDESSGFPLLWELPSLSLMNYLKKEAQRVNIPIVMHAPSFEGHKFGLRANIDIFAHSMWNWHKTPEQFLDLEFTDAYKEVLKEVSSRGIGYQFTFRTILGEVDLMKGDFTKNPQLAKVLPRDYLDWLNTEQGQWGKRRILNRANVIKKINPELYNHLQPQFESNEALFNEILRVFSQRINIVAKFLSDHNANLLFGTDNGAMNMSTNPPGYNGFLEMQHWYKAGIPLEKILLAATYNNAKAFNLDDRYGSIEKGKIANLLLLDENPLEHIAAYNQINSVIIGGKVYTRNELAADSSN